MHINNSPPKHFSFDGFFAGLTDEFIAGLLDRNISKAVVAIDPDANHMIELHINPIAT